MSKKSALLKGKENLLAKLDELEAMIWANDDDVELSFLDAHLQAIIETFE